MELDNHINALAQLEAPPESLAFSSAERAFFARQIQQWNLVNGALQNAVALVIEQNELTGQWRLKQDGSGLEKVGA